MKKRMIALAMACTLTVGCAIGGTLAWLIDSTNSVTNTFTVGDINIDLKEHKYDAENGKLSENETTCNNTYKFVPGDTLPKDPYVTVEKGSEDCYVFIKVEAANNQIVNGDDTVNNILDWTIDEKTDENSAGVWTKLNDVVDVYYTEVSSSTEDTTLNILKDQKVTVSSDVLKSMVSVINAQNTKPTLTFTAYAIQKDNLTDQNSDNVVNAADAWALINPTNA